MNLLRSVALCLELYVSLKRRTLRPMEQLPLTPKNRFSQSLFEANS